MAEKSVDARPKNLRELRGEKVTIKGRLIVWDFYKDDCGPCKLMEPTIRQLATECPEVDFIKVNVEKNPQLAAAYGVIVFPTIIIQDEELFVLVHGGRMPATKLRAAIKTALKEQG